MKLLIDKSLTIADVRSAFRNKFPLLDIKFYKKKHENFSGSAKADEYSESFKLKDLHLKEDHGELSISGSDSVEKVESLFEELFGLHAQVFRKSGSLWLQTVSTDNWTLDEQMMHAKEADITMKDVNN